MEAGAIEVMDVYVVKLYHLFKYLNFSDYELINWVENANENSYSDVYRLRDKIDEFRLVKFKQLEAGPVAYTKCHSQAVAIQRMKDVLGPLSNLGIQAKVDVDLLDKMLETNTKKADSELIKKLALFY